MGMRSIVCPRCGRAKIERIRRDWWMRLFPHSRCYFCLHCDTQFWRLFHAFSLKIR
ncbi:hypothetical protein Pcar_3326 [Syntrophotalea carbinolica DSM 2380]|uniref:LIM zinc-binding domain-containing protein n=1 Tax=Syntrophotalea carbinolica (strain DSM 2380 / NBRC 103641 / GraBd1) TaxID=338963 RepID=Q0C6J5_SYNC1|nr:hypothetical protein Pcar_3326 [Syntrophotalea carbinolica DSM 2380]